MARKRPRKKDRRPKLKLEQSWLYAIASMADLSRRLNVPATDLEVLAKAGNNYNFFSIQGRSIQEPKRRLQRIHARVHKLIARIETPEYLHSAVKGRSYVTNAEAHKDGGLIKIDVQRFFQSVPRHAIYRLFRDRFKCAGDVAGLLANLLTCDGHLATGSSASPVLSYYAYKDMFDQIAELAASLGLVMTCYVDDIAISGRRVTAGLLHEVRRVIAHHGLRGHKTKFFPPGRPRIVTGVALVGGATRVPNRRQLMISKLFTELSTKTTLQERDIVLRRLVSRLHEAAQVDKSWRSRAYNLQRQRKRLLEGALNATEPKKSGSGPGEA